ncbi:hypothetical protein P872_15570 [Rhodonellum psychrophilum GCM71 = DSM 17998]|uniref:N-(5'-phosphoribosyl)anthranilate isomerase n=2 Tax=Rhodonellum TaxID=336827 RepID=U5BU91_9BACT|nr:MULTISPECIES: phosphoribosylanthranilate isomerase [Rhodonellum]ERM84200.1 hypothetical protein P872_15570 [Rhodonellum psychrophilum GCM71 = DSM 17998]SDZ19123.1 phosphoribosylanthranilate isomerase [Rhodonellum ikkaensis]
MKLKVCGMRDPDNAREMVEGIHPDWMGLIFYPKSPRFVDDHSAAAIKALPVDKVGVFVNASLTEILHKIVLFGLKAVQLHSGESVAFVEELRQKTNVLIFKVFSVNEEIDWKSMEPYLENIDYFLFDTFTEAYGGSGKTFNWEILLDYPFEKPFLLSGGLGLENIAAIKALDSKIPQMAGVDINSKFEMEPGMKNLDLISRFRRDI